MSTEKRACKRLFYGTRKTSQEYTVSMPSSRPPKRTCVEDCLSIWIVRMPKGRNILRWRQGETEIASLEYERTRDEISFRAQTIAMKPQARSVRDHRFMLASPTSNEIPGQQWFLCECGRKCLKLYLPHGKNDFRCRDCHNLTHRSAQIHNGRLARLMLNPKELADALTSWHPLRRALAMRASLALPVAINQIQSLGQTECELCDRG